VNVETGERRVAGEAVGRLPFTVCRRRSGRPQVWSGKPWKFK